MHFHRGRVQAESLDTDAHNLLQLQLFKDTVEGAALGPAVHARVDGMPVAEPFRQSTPLASVLGYIQQSIQKLQVRQTYIAPLHWQAIRESWVVLFRCVQLLSLWPRL